jgi:hypothetical protein
MKGRKKVLIGVPVLVAVCVASVAVNVSYSVRELRSGNEHGLNNLWLMSLRGPLARRELASGSTPFIRAMAAQALDRMQATLLSGGHEPMPKANFDALWTALDDSSPLVRASSLTVVLRWGTQHRSRQEQVAVCHRFLQDAEAIPRDENLFRVSNTLGWGWNTWTKVHPPDSYTLATLTAFHLLVAGPITKPDSVGWPPKDLAPVIVDVRTKLDKSLESSDTR